MAAIITINPGLKRKSSTDENFVSKRFRFVLEHDEDSFSSSEEAESIYSLQEHDTATAHDTSDTDDHEFEVQSLSEVTVSELSSGPENNCVVIGNFNTIVDEFGSEISYVADLSDTFSSDEDEVGRISHKRCEKCKGECEEPSFTLCSKCFKQKRMYLPSRPRGKRRKNRGSSPKRGDSGISFSPSQGSFEGSEGSQGTLVGSSQGDDNLPSQEASQGSSQEAKVCKGCFANPVDGAFIHKNSVHTLFCYKCSVKQWRLYGRCPACNQKLCKVAKIFFVDD